MSQPVSGPVYTGDPAPRPVRTPAEPFVTMIFWDAGSGPRATAPKARLSTLTAMVAGGVTVTCALADLPPAEAVTVAPPTATEMRCPSAVMVTTDGLLDVHVIFSPMYFTPRLSVATPSRRMVSPTGITTVSGLDDQERDVLGADQRIGGTGEDHDGGKCHQERNAGAGAGAWGHLMVSMCHARSAGRRWQRSCGVDPGSSPAPRNAAVLGQSRRLRRRSPAGCWKPGTRT